MKKYTTKKIALIIAGLLCVGAFFYFYALAPEEEILLEEGVESTEEETILVGLFAELEQVSFSRDVFDSPLLRELTDWSVALTPQTPGRENPFATRGVGRAPITEEEQDTATTTE